MKEAETALLNAIHDALIAYTDAVENSDELKKEADELDLIVKRDKIIAGSELILPTYNPVDNPIKVLLIISNVPIFSSLAAKDRKVEDTSDR